MSRQTSESTETSELGTLIVGAGQAGHTIAMTMRRRGYSAPLSVVGAEQHVPYTRPPLSKAYLLGGVEPADFRLSQPDALASAGVELVLGEAVHEISAPGSDAPGTAVTDAGRTFVFDRLALAVGGAPVRLDIPGINLEGVHYLRDLDDAQRLRTALSQSRHFVIVGGGFIGLEAAAVARSLGVDVTVVEAEDRLLGRAVAPVVSSLYATAHARRGVRIRLSTKAVAFHGTGHVAEVEVAPGDRVPADLVLICVGLRPRTELARQLGLVVSRGILVDESARTSNPLVCAAGDCTEFPHPAAEAGERISLESVQNALDQARVAAATLAGQAMSYASVPWFWSDQDSLKLQIAGWSRGYDDHLVLGDPDEEQCAVVYFREGKLVAIDAINRPADYQLVRRALARGAAVGRDAFDDSDRLPAEVLT